MALSVNRAEQRKLLNEMDKLGLPASEPVFEAIIAGHLFARDVTSSYEALIAGRREGFKLHQAHSHHVAAMVQTGAVDPAVRTCSSPPRSRVGFYFTTTFARARADHPSL